MELTRHKYTEPDFAGVLGFMFLKLFIWITHYHILQVKMINFFGSVNFEFHETTKIYGGKKILWTLRLLIISQTQI